MHYRTHIVATLGPATSNVHAIKRLASMGMDIARLNFSHGSHETHGANIRLLQRLQKEGHNIAILLDTKGPEIRTGDVESPIIINEGDSVFFTSKSTGKATLPTVRVNYDEFPRDARKSKQLFIDNGVMEFEVTSVKPNGVVAKALDSGSIGSRRHVNLPGVYLSLPSFTKKDWGDVDFGIKMGVDFIAPSFVREGKDILELRTYLDKKESPIHIVAKIETKQAVENIDEIIDHSDAIMVARGDLGSEVPFELVPGIQNDIVRRCRAKGKPVIVATHMLESMIQNPTPTRAEVTDIAYASAICADCTMLSGETANGKYPFKAIAAMRKILDESERRYETDDAAIFNFASKLDHEPRTEQARSACVLASKIDADAIVAITKHGHTARAISMFRPSTRILAFTPTSVVARQLRMAWGVHPAQSELYDDPEKTVSTALSFAVKNKLLKAGMKVVVVSDILVRTKDPRHSRVMSVQIRNVA